MQRFFLWPLAVIGAISILLFFGGFVVFLLSVAAWSGNERGIPQDTVLAIEFEQPVVETGGAGRSVRPHPHGRLPTLRDIVDSIDHAWDDDRITALVGGSVGSSSASPSSRKCGMRSSASASPGSRASPSRRRSVNSRRATPRTTASVRQGLPAAVRRPQPDRLYLESPFVKGTPEKIGIDPEIDKRWEYKNAADMYLQKGVHPRAPGVESAPSMRLRADHRRDRRVARHDLDEVRGWIDKCPLIASDALDAGFIDGLKYADQVDAELGVRDDSHVVGPTEYIKVEGVRTKAQCHARARPRIRRSSAEREFGRRIRRRSCLRRRDRRPRPPRSRRQRPCRRDRLPRQLTRRLLRRV
ncbi:MAG: hypothetical protein R3E97_10585 [Candidatus Eisenbacteria bacterium]